MGAILGTTEAALMLGMSAENIRLLEKSGRLPAMKTPSGRRIFKLEDVERLRLEREAQRQAKQEGHAA